MTDAFRAGDEVADLTFDPAPVGVVTGIDGGTGWPLVAWADTRILVEVVDPARLLRTRPAGERGEPSDPALMAGLVEAVTGATQDPRATALLAADGMPLNERTVPKLLADIDRADAAAGIRRVPDIDTIDTCSDLLQLTLRNIADHLAQGEVLNEAGVWEPYLPPEHRRMGAKYRRGYSDRGLVAIDSLRRIADMNGPGGVS